MSADLLTPEQAAAKLAINPKTLAQWRYRGEGPTFVKLGKRAVRYDIADLDAWIESQKAGA